MDFEFDEGKSRANEKKHGISFVEAQKLWEGPSIEFSARQEYENRFAVIGEIIGKLYTCIYTLRGERIRIISCRRSREKERSHYEENIRRAR